MRISDWSSDVCSSDLALTIDAAVASRMEGVLRSALSTFAWKRSIGRSCGNMLLISFSRLPSWLSTCCIVEWRAFLFLVTPIGSCCRFLFRSCFLFAFSFSVLFLLLFFLFLHLLFFFFFSFFFFFFFYF